MDLIRQRIYFADAHLDYIESCDYFGQKRVQILANDLFLHHPHSLSFFEDHIFWVDRGHMMLAKKNRLNSNKTAIAELSPFGLTVKVAHSLLQPQEDNPCAQANCEHLCLLSPASATGYRCECQVGYIRDQQNTNRCNLDDSEFLIVLNDNIIGGIRISPNDTSQYDDDFDRTTTAARVNSDESVDTDDSSSTYFSTSYSSENDFLWDRMIPVSNIVNGYDFAYDFKDQIVYFLQHNYSSSAINIDQVSFDGSNRTGFTSNNQQNVNSPYCIETDPSSRNIFVGNFLKSYIEVYNMKTRHRTVLFGGSNNIYGVGFPQMLAINYIESELYWIDDGLEQVPRKVGAVKLDGSSPRIIAQYNLNHLVAIYYHIKGRRVYWADAGRNCIESALIDGTDRNVVLANVEHPSALAIWDVIDPRTQESVSIMYYSDVAYEQIIAYNIRTQEKHILRNNVPNVMKLQIYQKPQLAYENPCLINNGGCHHICLPSNSISSRRICRCCNGLKLMPDGSCVLFKRAILYSSRTIITGLQFGDEPSYPGSEFSDGMHSVSGNGIGKVDFDFKTRTIIWIENGMFVKAMILNQSWVSSVDGIDGQFYSTKVLFEIDSFFGTLMGLAVDWINNMLYYSYNEGSQSYIKVCKLPSCEFHYTILSTKEDKPFVLAVNPKLRYLYWIDQGQTSKLERALLNGENRTVLVKTDIISPTDISIDIATGDVYWTDNTKDRIERVSWDGSNRVIVKSNAIPNPVGVGILNNMLYYADSRLRGIYSMNLTAYNLTTNSTAFVTRDATLIRKLPADDLQDIALFDEITQPMNIDSPCTLNLCDQFCFALPMQSVAKCACAIGELDSNGRTCKTPKEYLVFAMENEIRSLNLIPPSVQNAQAFSTPWKAVTGLTLAVGIDFDYQSNKIFFSDVREKKLSWFYVNEENPQIRNIMIQNTTSSSWSWSFSRNISSPDGIAYDWVSDTIYWCDSQLKQVISLNVNSGMRYVIAYGDTPRAIVVHPCKGYLFWTDVGRVPIIARSSLAGSDYKPIVRTDIKWPNGLTIDFDDDKLYWADAFFDRIERSNLDGNYRQVLSTALHPFALTVHHHYIYWTDWSTGSVYRAEKYSGSNMVPLVTDLSSRPMDIHVWSEQRQKCQYNPCSSYNGGCSHICTVAPPGNKTECRCPTGLRLRLANNDRTCVSVTPSRCNSTQFTCSNGNCIK